MSSSYVKRRGVIDNIAKVLAILAAEQKNYSYIDKIGYAPSSELALHYLKEALRDFRSLIEKEKIGGEFDCKAAKEEISKVDFDAVEKGIDEIANTERRNELRALLSFMTSKALVTSARLSMGD